MSHYLSIPLVLSIAAGTSLSAGRFNFTTKLLLNGCLSETAPYGSDATRRACWEMCPFAKPIVPGSFCEKNCPEFYKCYDKYFREDFKRLMLPGDSGCLSALSYSFPYISEDSDVEIAVKCFLICPPIDDIGSFCLNNCREYVRCYANDLEPASSAARDTSTPSYPIETPGVAANEIDRSPSSVVEHDPVSVTPTSTLTQLYNVQNNHDYMTLLLVVAFGAFGIVGVLSALGVLAVVILRRKGSRSPPEREKKQPLENTESLIHDSSNSNISEQNDYDSFCTQVNLSLHSDPPSLENHRSNAHSRPYSQPRTGCFFQSRTNS